MPSVLEVEEADESVAVNEFVERLCSQSGVRHMPCAMALFLVGGAMDFRISEALIASRLLIIF